jgi:hypothetical protein
MNEQRRQTVEEALERIQAAIDQGHLQHVAMLQRFGQRRRWERRLEREARRAARRRSAPMEGAIRLIAAAFLGIMAFRSQNLWWLVLPAIGLAISGIRRIVAANESEPKDKTAEDHDNIKPPAGDKMPSEIDRSLARVDQWGDRLLAEVKRGPDVLRDVLRKPEETVEAIRQGCHALARREAELRALVTPEDDDRLSKERDGLVKRLESEADEVTRQRLSAALVALDEQRKQRAELLTAASRMEAERTRLSYVLESLYTQVLRIRSADSASAQVAGQGLKKSLQSLGDEVGALADALESVNRDEQLIAPLSSPSEASPETPLRTREKI